MAYEKVSDLSTDTVVKLGGLDSKTGKPNPTSMEGYYLGFRTVKSENGTSTIFVFQTPKGNKGVWGTADLVTKLGEVKRGTMTLIEYKGKIKLAGGKTKHTYDVSRDVSNTIAVSELPTGVNAASEANYEDTDDLDGNQEAYGSDDDTSQIAALAAAERAAKVQALLKNKSK